MQNISGSNVKDHPFLFLLIFHDLQIIWHWARASPAFWFILIATGENIPLLSKWSIVTGNLSIPKVLSLLLVTAVNVTNITNPYITYLWKFNDSNTIYWEKYACLMKGVEYENPNDSNYFCQIQYILLWCLVLCKILLLLYMIYIAPTVYNALYNMR